MDRPETVMPPQVVRIKRKRTQDPLQALSIKRTRTDSFMFKLAGTFDQEPADKDFLLREEDEAKQPEDKRVFRLNKRAKRRRSSETSQTTEPKVPESLTDMVQTYLSEHATSPEAAPSLSSPPSGGPVVLGMDHEVEDYVYDIYYREKYIAKEWDRATNIGVIVFDSDDEEFLAGLEDIEDSDRSDEDEDSNAEDFYRNDYPEEEDLSESEGSGNPFSMSELREGLEYTETEKVQDDEESENDSLENDNDNMNDDDDVDWDAYRDRILGSLERDLASRS